ncbi:malate dehydrogenase [Pyrus ussuriensis x Pyrus communis]|uniref:Malate dehydrogenase n=1 Tax=Pyrus ussuriensis x Pyrus communis TaxID=2448454 RepID=A0A5N5FHL8_9ROSA|nr:malate dehydrogenase [Pyrus ussuriensis x Pyrus communis]
MSFCLTLWWMKVEDGSTLSRADCRAKGGAPGIKVAIVGAAGRIGQPLAMLMKMNPLVSVLHLYDVVNAPGVMLTLVSGFLGQPQLESALTGIDLVIIPTVVPRKPGRTRDDLFNINAGIAVVNLIGNPVNCTVPIAVEVFKKAGTYDPKRLLGVTMLDVVRANTFVVSTSRTSLCVSYHLCSWEVDVPVIGGHAGVTILPLLPGVVLVCWSFNKILFAILQAKAGASSATLSMAYAAVEFAYACLRGLRGDAGVVECTFVASEVTELPFFATKVRLGRSGAEEIYQLGPLNEYERIGLEELAASIQKGVSFIKK